MTHASTTPSGRGRVLLRWLGHVLLVAAWLVIALMALLTWGPHLTRYKTEVIVGQSMEPTIPLWSVIVVEPVDPVDVRKGDVIVAQPAMLDGRKVTHRVIEVLPSKDGHPSFQTQGDNNDTPDPWTVAYEDRGWRVIHHVPHVGWIMSKAQTKGARLLLVVAPVLLVLLHVLRWIWRSEDDVDEPATEPVQWAYFDETPAATEPAAVAIRARGPDEQEFESQLELEPLPEAEPAPELMPEPESAPEPEPELVPESVPIPAPVGLHVTDPLPTAVATLPRRRRVSRQRRTVARVTAIAIPLALVALRASRGRRGRR